MTNFRAAGKDDSAKLPPARKFSLEEALGYDVKATNMSR
jgi:predicted membrane GTPase involved in stress response